jgi:DNA primase
MAQRFSEQFLADLLARIDIVDLVDARVPLKRSGGNFKACCPFHSEKTPSFNVSRSKQFYHCFGCGAHGDAIDFLRNFDRLDFAEAVVALAESVGMPLPDPDSAADDREQRQRTGKIYDLQARVAQFYRQQLRSHPQAQRAVAYLKQRGITGEVARRYGLGYAPPGWTNFPEEFQPDELMAAGLQISKPPSRYDRFRDRIMFPIRDRRGRVVGFGGRVLDDSQPKYLNSPETQVFRKHEQVYGLFEALQDQAPRERFLVVEGYMDVIALAQWGFPHSVATLGTATSAEQIELLFRHADELVFCFDGDEAGQKAAWKALLTTLPVLPEGRTVRFLSLPQGEDPDSLVRREGTAAFRARVDAGRLLSDYFFEHLGGDLPPDSIESRTALINRAAPLLQSLKPGPFRQLMRARLAELTRPSARPAPPPRRPQRDGARGRTARLSGRARLLMLLIQHPELLLKIDAPMRALLVRDNGGGGAFARLFAALEQAPEIGVGEIRARFQGTPESALIDELCAAESLIDGEALETEFRDTLALLTRQSSRERLEELIGRAEALNEEERAEMRHLLESSRDSD